MKISAVAIQSGSGLSTLLFGFGAAILLIAFYVWLFRRAQQGLGGMGGCMGGMGGGMMSLPVQEPDLAFS